MTGLGSTPPGGTVPNEINTNVPQSARVYDYWLGGKDHFPADRAMGEAIAEALPTIRTQVRAAGVPGAGRALPGPRRRGAAVPGHRDRHPERGNVHDVAQEIAPESRVLYVDNDPIVMVHARALMAGTAEGTVAFIQADLREPEAILGDPAVAGTLDLAQPVGLVLIGVMHHLRDDDDPRRVVATLVDALAPGSYLVLSQTDPRLRPRGDARPGRGVGAGRDPQRAPQPRRHRAVLRRPGAGRARPGAAGRPGGPTPAPSAARTPSTPTAGSPASPNQSGPLARARKASWRSLRRLVAGRQQHRAVTDEIQTGTPAYEPSPACCHRSRLTRYRAPYAGPSWCSSTTSHDGQWVKDADNSRRCQFQCPSDETLQLAKGGKGFFDPKGAAAVCGDPH